MSDDEDPLSRVHTFHHHPLLGTTVIITVAGLAADVAERAADAAVATIERLESTFSAYRHDSELNRWKRGELDEASTELVEVLAAALDWQQRSAGAFNPLTGMLTNLWNEAAEQGVRPDRGALERAANSIAVPRFIIEGGVPIVLDDCADLNLNAIAKGYIVDRAAQRAFAECRPSALLVSAGGDIARVGDGTSVIGIENPLRPYDNEPSIARIAMGTGGLATSGGSRRGFMIDGHRHSHVIDPRTGEPVDQQWSISIVAPSAMDADAIATVAGLMAPDDAVEIDDVGVFVVDTDGRTWSNGAWDAAAVDLV